MPFLTQDRAREVLGLDVDTGVLTWRVSTWSRAVVGARAGSFHKSSGYRYVSVDGKRYREHVLIWFMVHGEWRPRLIDHRDLDRSNNRLSNLRLATESQQRSNAKLRSDNKTGERGVYFNKRNQNFNAEIKVDGKKLFLGAFPTIEAAASVARTERLKFFGPFAPLSDQARGF